MLATKHCVKVFDVLKAAVLRDVSDRQVGFQQQRLRMFQPATSQFLKRRAAHLPREVNFECPPQHLPPLLSFSAEEPTRGEIRNHPPGSSISEGTRYSLPTGRANSVSTPPPLSRDWAHEASRSALTRPPFFLRSLLIRKSGNGDTKRTSRTIVSFALLTTHPNSTE